MAETILNAKEMAELEARLAEAILAAYPVVESLVIVGIERRGADLARRLVNRIKKLGKSPGSGSLDINLYRDDWTSPDGVPVVGLSQMPQNISHKNVLLVDDVLFTGRTIRAALEALQDYGRPARVELLVLIDRGHRELPIAATYIGKTIATDKDWHIDVLLEERDGRDEVILHIPEN